MFLARAPRADHDQRPNAPAVGTVLTKGESPMNKLKMTPLLYLTRRRLFRTRVEQPNTNVRRPQFSRQKRARELGAPGQRFFEAVRSSNARQTPFCWGIAG